MIPTYLESDFNEQALSCSHCNWKGKGYETVIIDFYGVTDNKEVHCPSCDSNIGILHSDKKGPPGESANELSFQIG